MRMFGRWPCRIASATGGAATAAAAPGSAIGAASAAAVADIQRDGSSLTGTLARSDEQEGDGLGEPGDRRKQQLTGTPSACRT